LLYLLYSWRMWHLDLIESKLLEYSNDSLEKNLSIIEYWNTNNFYFILFYFSFRRWRGMWHYSYMTGHMMWCHRPRRWWKDLEDNVRAYVYNMATLRQTWERSMNIRTGLIISSTDHEDFVVVATTYQNSTCSLLTSAKLLVGYLIVGIIRELDKEPSLYCSSIYINTRWSVLQQY